ncbi:UDP-N-acetylmuramoyl-L-alanyl-D-glutamate--2,6-diaminopimelate ligase [Caldibacillus debilis]|uniref:UDP-N-acetylmuramoyl-L-alanyl-D-glutamate--2, 6-diaminopimelate ligase n=1 Tax=Caldibacillus debilis TaxID=301148 RepID=UPI002FDAC799
MKLQELLQVLPFYKIFHSSDPEILSLENDHRKVKKGSLFFCIEGTKTDGHRFAREAVDNGAAAVVAKRPLPLNVPVVVVNDTARAMAVMADAFYSRPSHSLRVIGITGTNGKTTVSHMIDQIFRSVRQKTGLIGTLYVKIAEDTYETKNTTPDCLTLQKHLNEMKKRNVAVVTMEVSSHALDQGRVRGIDFDVAVFTNLTQDHLDYHRTMDEYLRVKSLLFSQLGNHYNGKRKKFAILNKDDGAADLLARSTSAHVLTYGIKGDADVRAEAIRYSNRGMSYRVITPVGEETVEMKLIGEFNVYNSLAAIACGIACGLKLEEIVEGLRDFRSVPGRFELVDCGQPFPVIVDYAHTPDSLENVLKTIRSFAGGRIFVVVGCGGDRDPKKRPIMAQVACRYGTDPIFTSDNPRSEDPLKILADMEAGVRGLHYEIVPDRKEAIGRAISQASSGDVVLIAGKGHETYQIVGDRVFEFDDRLVAKQCIEDRLKKDRLA